MPQSEIKTIITKQFQDNEPSAIFNAMAQLAGDALKCNFDEAMFVLNTIVAIETGKADTGNFFQRLAIQQQIIPSVASSITRLLNNTSEALDQLISDTKSSTIQEVRDSHPALEYIRNDMR